jgi:hypothetical protein
LRIDLIHALRPQAKGRVKRANQTLQDRLVREMRLRGISTIEAGQAFAPIFMAQWNAWFAVAPRESEDARRPWRESPEALDEALARRRRSTIGASNRCPRPARPRTRRPSMSASRRRFYFARQEDIAILR